MRLLINGELIPNVCKELVDPSNCQEILLHCKPTDSNGECVLRMFSEATVNTIKDTPGFAHDSFHFAAKSIDAFLVSGVAFQTRLDNWYYTTATIKLEDKLVAKSLSIFGYFIDSIVF